MKARANSASRIVAATSGVLAATLAVGLQTGNADAGATSVRVEAAKKQPILRAFFEGRTVQYLNFGRINLRPGNKVSTIWRIGGGVPGQRDVIAAVPGSATYSALVRVREVTWASGARPRPLRSAADVVRARARGEVTVATTRTVLNAPVLGFRQTRHAGFARNRTIHYYELGKVAVAPGNEVLPIWTFTNGVDGQANIADVEPGTTDYPPLWAVVQVTWRPGASRRLIRSFEALSAAEKSGELTLRKTPDVVNCPFV